MRRRFAICLAVLSPIWFNSRDVHQREPQEERDNLFPTLRFSGYDWKVKTSEGRVGPGPNLFGAGGVKVDSDGHLHLGIMGNRGRWICSEVASQRTFGYGEYRFVIRHTASLDVNAVLGLFLWDITAPEKTFGEVDIEVSRWGDSTKANGQFVVQPGVSRETLDRFELAGGRAVLSLKWTPGLLFCRAVVGGKVIREHVFSQGIPDGGEEQVRMNAWLYRAVPPTTKRNVEVIIERFEFLPFVKSK